MSPLKLSISGSLLFLLLSIVACKKNSEDGGGNNNPQNNNCTVSFSLKVAAIVQTNCAFSPGCHSAGSTNSGGPFTNHTQIFNRRTSIKSAVQSGIMPQGGSLSASDKAVLINWIDCGAPNN
jgi:hypothetical protein